MQDAFEKIISKINEKIEHYDSRHKILTDSGMFSDADRIAERMAELDFAKEIVKQEAEQFGTDTNVGSNGWIPCSEHQPDYGERVLLQDFYGNITLEKCKRKKKVKGFTDGNWWSSANNYIAWQPLPQPYQPKGE